MIALKSWLTSSRKPDSAEEEKSMDIPDSVTRQCPNCHEAIPVTKLDHHVTLGSCNQETLF